MKNINFNNINSISSYNNISEIKNFLFPEICFAGRSNVGKSSLINSILNRKKIATTSNKPGHTKKVFFYNVDNSFSLVDLPGYGYANVAKRETDKLSSLIFSYLSQNKMLFKVFILIDSRHGLKSNDISFLTLLKNLNLNYQFIFTKSDKRSKSIDNNNLYLDKITQTRLPIIFASAKTKEGVKQIRSEIINGLKEINDKKI